MKDEILDWIKKGIIPPVFLAREHPVIFVSEMYQIQGYCSNQYTGFISLIDEMVFILDVMKWKVRHTAPKVP